MNQCGCDRCINFKLVRSSLTSNGVKDVPCQATECVVKTMCPLMNIILDLLQYKQDCIFQQCNTCSDPTTSFNNVLMCAKNKNLKRKVSGKRWMSTTKEINGKESSAFEHFTVWGTFEEIIDEYVCDVLNMWQTSFSS